MKFSPMAIEVLRILQAEPLLTVASLQQVLKAAVGLYTTDVEIGVALDELMKVGRIERVHSARLQPRYRIMSTKPVDMSEPETAA